MDKSSRSTLTLSSRRFPTSCWRLHRTLLERTVQRQAGQRGVVRLHTADTTRKQTGMRESHWHDIGRAPSWMQKRLWLW